jgi:phosphonate transport system substrate-binding protein
MLTELLRFTSCQAEIAEFTCREVTAYIGQRLQLPTVFVDDLPWQERLQQFDAGAIHVCWFCGLPYVWRADQPNPPIDLLAAPVMAAPRYQGRPVYFSDVVVRADSPWQSFAELRGQRWAYNEPGSQSGYNITRYHLATLGATRGFFGKVIASGAHQRSLELLWSGEIDATAIDSTVLELAYERDPTPASAVRVIATLGPSPIPPWVIRREVPARLRGAIRTVLLEMHADPAGQAILRRGQMLGFAAVADQDYDPIRQMARIAEPVRW